MYRTVTLDVDVGFDDFQRAHERAIRVGDSTDIIRVSADVDVDEVLEQATIDELRAAFSREADPGYTQEQLDAIRDFLRSVRCGQLGVALALLPRIFEHQAQVAAAEAGLAA